MKDTKVNQYYFEELLSAVTAELLKLPAGRLVQRGKRYYHVVNEKEVGITKKPELIQQLRRKNCLLNLKKRLEKNVLIFSKAISNLVSINPEEIIRTLPASYQDVPISHFNHPTIEKWLARPRKENTFKGKKYEVKKGVKVRSKSEYMIACLLDEYGIFYLYEVVITLDGETISPDFIIINLFTGKIIIWEHFGALHESKYAKKMNTKMGLYLNHGFIPFETIIYTFEFDMNISRLKKLIEDVILGWNRN